MTGKRVSWCVLWLVPALAAQGQAPPGAPAQSSLPPSQNSQLSEGETESRLGTALTREGRFAEAIPHLTAARGRVTNEYAVSFNLALCYLGLRQYQQAIDVLQGLRANQKGTAQVENLLAQAYMGVDQPENALAALRRAASLTPLDEKLYTFVADACTDNKEYELGLRVVGIGLHHLPSSARLHYERAMFLARLDRFEEAKPEFERAVALAPESDIAYLASAQNLLFQGDVQSAIRTVRKGINKGHHDYVLQDLLAEVLIHAGAMPGQPEFVEARTLLESAVAQKPDYSTAQIALGKLYLMEGRFNEAVTHLEIGRRLEPQNPAVYSSLADAYRRLGEEQKAHEMLDQLKVILQKEGQSEPHNQQPVEPDQ
ncbi:tetratricopeptide repeat protein [Alloacidobacterium dinghuense]|uniref:Tetratricopeptide repeat protein n=1 Tax=Alloacidobacterium dinghuense TaxID=2763107 RepID=A0A7G8BLW0_9BACT|nr:tetratricopeptide repeat protein [Alloacidobacterium dinghuense]QNI33530.1 tetratricopeptide repeat protein [Alloacidobacterium dinghuense]